jgi:hypothetical protein
MMPLAPQRLIEVLASRQHWERKGRRMTQQPAILAILPDEKFTGLLEDLKASGATVLHVFSCAVAQRILASQVPICLIVTVPRLADGSWRSLLTTALSRGSNPQVMVVAEEMDGGWTDLLDMGVWHVWTPAVGRENFMTACNSAIETWLSLRRIPSRCWGRTSEREQLTRGL